MSTNMLFCRTRVERSARLVGSFGHRGVYVLGGFGAGEEGVEEEGETGEGYYAGEEDQGVEGDS